MTKLVAVLKCPQELAFQKLVFVTMLAWEDPYTEDDGPLSSLDNYSVLVKTYSSMFSKVCTVNRAPKTHSRGGEVHYYGESIFTGVTKNGF